MRELIAESRAITEELRQAKLEGNFKYLEELVEAQHQIQLKIMERVD